jgi:glycosyltransferase involved in cell wall biosynthesis
MRVNLSGYITATTSYGLVTLNFLKSLSDAGIEVDLHGPVQQENFGVFGPYVRKTHEQSQLFDSNAISLRIAHQFDMAPSIGSGPRAGYTFFEMNRLTPLEVHHLASLDALIVPTQWAKTVCSDSGIESVVCPPGYDHTIFSPVDYMPPQCVFLSVGKWETRKQQDQIVKAFYKAFSPKDNVNLWMSCDNKFMPQIVEERKNNYKDVLKDKIKIINRVTSHEDLARIVQQSYCFVAPSLAEGWNLPLLEAMGCGKFNIATNYSGHTEFCTEESTVLIEPSGLVPADDGMWFRPGSKTNNGEWCSYKEDDLIESMRIIYKKYCSGQVLNKRAIDQASKFTWAKSSGKLIEELRYILCGVATKRNQNMGLYEESSEI